MKKHTYLIIMLSIISISVFGQGGTPTNIRTGINFLGFNAGVPGDLQIRNNLVNQSINFFAGGTGPLFQRMTIQGTTGFVGINTAGPSQLLTVQSGNINVTNGPQNNGYMIGDVMTMWRGQNGLVTNIFVGSNAGAANTTGANNTFVGNNAGINNTVAVRNTFVGNNSGSGF